jgi:hypothetical protein
MAIHDRNFYKSIIRKMIKSQLDKYEKEGYKYTLQYNSYTNVYCLYYTAPGEKNWSCAAIKASEI